MTFQCYAIAVLRLKILSYLCFIRFEAESSIGSVISLRIMGVKDLTLNDRAGVQMLELPVAY